MFALLFVSAGELLRLTAAIAMLPPVSWSRPWGGIERYEPAPDYRAARSIYLHSVVPGGVLSEAEVEASIARDPVVARHYRDILSARLELTRLNAPVEVYASYRSSNSIYWTTHKIHLPKGELILSDGFHMIRARCGNRLTFTSPALDEPIPLAMGTEEPPKEPAQPIIVEPPEQVFEYGIPPIFGPANAAEPRQTASPSREAHFWPPPETPLPLWCCGVGGFPGSLHPPRPVRPKPRPPAIPEPAAGFLLATGILVAAIKHRKRGECQRLRTAVVQTPKI